MCIPLKCGDFPRQINMRYTGLVTIVLFLQCVTTSFQCEKCRRDDLYLNHTKSWVPLRGTGQLAFVDYTGARTDFAVRGLDTTVVNTTECGDTYNYQYIINTLYLNTAKTDSIVFRLFNKSHLEARGMSNGSYQFAMWDLLGKAKEGRQAKSFDLFIAGTKRYKDVILIFRNDYSTNTLDSVLIANNTGIVAFKYYGKSYTLL